MEDYTYSCVVAWSKMLMCGVDVPLETDEYNCSVVVIIDVLFLVVVCVAPVVPATVDIVVAG